MATLEKPTDFLDARAAVAAAKEFAAKLFASEKISRLGLEEIELSDDGKWWLVTLGFARPWAKRTVTGRSLFPLDHDLREEEMRVYKVFRVDSKTGEVASVKMYDTE